MAGSVKGYLPGGGPVVNESVGRGWVGAGLAGAEGECRRLDGLSFQNGTAGPGSSVKA